MSTRNMGLDADDIVPTVNGTFRNTGNPDRRLRLSFSALDLTEEGLLQELLTNIVRFMERNDSYQIAEEQQEPSGEYVQPARLVYYEYDYNTGLRARSRKTKLIKHPIKLTALEAREAWSNNTRLFIPEDMALTEDGDFIEQFKRG